MLSAEPFGGEKGTESSRPRFLVIVCGGARYALRPSGSGSNFQQAAAAAAGVAKSVEAAERELTPKAHKARKATDTLLGDGSNVSGSPNPLFYENSGRVCLPQTS